MWFYGGSLSKILFISYPFLLVTDHFYFDTKKKFNFVPYLSIGNNKIRSHFIHIALITMQFYLNIQLGLQLRCSLKK